MISYAKPDARILHLSGPIKMASLDKVMALKEAITPDVIVVSGGLVGEGSSFLDKGRTMVSALNEIGVTHVSLGRNDLLLPKHILAKRIREFRGVVLSTNLDEPDLATKEYSATKGCAFTGVTGGVSPRYCFGESRLEEAMHHDRKNVLFVSTAQTEAEDVQLTAIQGGINLKAKQQRPKSLLALVLGSHPAGAYSNIGRSENRIRIAHAQDGEFTDIEFYDTSRKNIVARTRKISAVKGTAKFFSKTFFSVLKRFADSKRAINDVIIPSSGSSLEELKASLLECVKDVLEVDVCVAHNGSFAGSAKNDYSNTKYADLSEILPYPTQMTVIGMSGKLLSAMVSYTPPMRGRGDAPDFKERSLVFNTTFEHMTIEDHKTYLVAVPKLLAGGLYNIKHITSSTKGTMQDHPSAPLLDLIGAAVMQELQERPIE